jgi:hypothetical protein
MSVSTVEISAKGKRFIAAAVDIHGLSVAVSGKYVRIASVHDEDWHEDEIRDPETFVAALKERRSKTFNPDLFTFAQKLPDIERRYSYPMKWDNVAAVRLDDPKKWWEGLPQETRKNVRRAGKRGVVTTVTEFNDELVTGIQGIYNESPMRHGKRFWHYQKDFETVKRENGTYLDRSSFIGTYSGNDLIGFMKVVNVGKVATIMQIVSKMSEFDKRPMNALIAKAVEHCAAQGMAYLVYGKYNYGSERNSSLTVFKERNGFEKLLIPRYFVPLTLQGNVAISLKLHRDAIEIAPEWMLAGFRRFRGMWQSSKLSRKPV